jgi:predicted transcriptional regulator
MSQLWRQQESGETSLIRRERERQQENGYVYIYVIINYYLYIHLIINYHFTDFVWLIKGTIMACILITNYIL